MKNTKSKKSIIGILILLAVFASSDLLAQRMNRNFGDQQAGRGRYHQNMGQGRMMNNDFYGNERGFGLNLSEEQLAQAKDLRTKGMKEMLPIRNSIQEKRARLQTLRTAENYDAKAVNNIIDEISELRSKQMKMREAHRQEFRSLLTEDQRVICDSRNGRMGNRNFGKGNKRGGRRAFR